MHFVIGIKFTLKPSWPWKQRYIGWWPVFFFIHLLVKVGFGKAPNKNILLRPRQTRARELRKTLDPTKRKSLSPGTRPIPKGYRLSDQFDEAIPPKKPKQDEPKLTQPGTKTPQDKLVLERIKKQGGLNFQHKFFGSQLIVNNIPVVRGLDCRLHKLEITNDNRLFIDNIPFDLNPHDLIRVRDELLKQQTV